MPRTNDRIQKESTDSCCITKKSQRLTHYHADRMGWRRTDVEMNDLIQDEVRLVGAHRPMLRVVTDDDGVRTFYHSHFTRLIRET